MKQVIICCMLLFLTGCVETKVYDSSHISKTEEREKGEKEFANKTASMNVVSYKSFIKRNLLIFYVHGENLNSNQVPFENEIQEALDSLIEG